MATSNEPLQLNLGSLRSAMSLTLHTHHASRIWHGRAAAEGRPGIVGLNGYIAVMNKMKRGSEQDDPYSDWWMLRIEDKLDQTRTTLQTLRKQVDQALAGVPAALSLGENLNVQPVKLPLFVNAQLGFAAVYLLADYDDIARKLILAHHTALIDRSTLERWLNEGAHALRSLFSLAQQYRYSGCTRDDFAAKNAAARAALEKFGAFLNLAGLAKIVQPTHDLYRIEPHRNCDLAERATLDNLDGLQDALSVAIRFPAGLVLGCCDP